MWQEQFQDPRGWSWVWADKVEEIVTEVEEIKKLLN